MKIRWWIASAAGLMLLTTGCEVEQTANESSSFNAIEPEQAAVAPKPPTPERVEVAQNPAPARPSLTPVAETVPNILNMDDPLPVPPGYVPVIVNSQESPPPVRITVRQSNPSVSTGRSAAAINRSASTNVTLPRRVPAATAGRAVTPGATGVPPVVPVLPQDPRSTTLSAPPRPVVSPPSPVSLANRVEVSGVIQVGGRTSAIVRVPTENSSRYVDVGDNLANGSIQVKRIEVGANQEPVVVLEQNGVEVQHAVGNTGGS